MTSGRRILYLLAVLGVALGLRLLGLEWGLGLAYHPDELPKLHRAHGMAWSDFNPHHFKHPSVLIDLLAGIAWLDPVNLGAPEELARYHYNSRVAIALIGAATLLPIYLAGVRLLGTHAAQFAIALFAVAPLAVQTAHYVKEDVPMVFWLAISLAGAARILRQGDVSAYVMAGFAAGAAASSKYPGVLTLVPLAAAHWGRRLRQQSGFRALAAPKANGLLALAVVTAVIGFLLFTPFAIIDPASFREGVLFELRHVQTGHKGNYFSPWEYAWSFHLLYSIVPGLRWPAALAGCAALAWAIARPTAERLVLVCGALTYYLLVEASPLKPFPNFERYVLPVLPYLVLLTGGLVDVAITRFQSWRPGWPAGLLWATAALVLIVPGIVRSVRFDRGLVPDTRDLAEAWIRENVPSGSSIYVEDYCPRIDDSLHGIKKAPVLARFSEGKLAAADYLVTSSMAHDRYLFQAERFPRIQSFYEGLRQNGYLLQRFETANGPYGFNNPVIEIYAGPAPSRSAIDLPSH